MESCSPPTITRLDDTMVSSNCPDDKRRPPQGAAPRAFYRQTEKTGSFTYHRLWIQQFWRQATDQVLSSPASVNSSKVPSGQTLRQPDQYLRCNQKTSFMSNVLSVSVPWVAGGPMLVWKHCKAPQNTQRNRVIPF